MASFRLREIVASDVTDDDLAALAGLDAAVSDGGKVAFTPRHLLPERDHLALMRGGSVGVLAQDQGSGQVIGAAWVRFASCVFAGRAARAAIFNSLQVHPSARRKGVAKALTAWRLERAEGQATRHEPVVPMASIQQGNEASLANALRWATFLSPSLKLTPVPMRRRAPRPRRPWIVRDISSGEVDRVAAALSAQYQVFGLSPRVEPEDLRGWLALQLHGTPLNRYLVLTGLDGVPIAGIGLHYEARHTQVQVSGLSAPMRIAGWAAGVVPPSGLMRNLQAVLPWSAPETAAAGTLLWNSVRSRERAQGTAVVTTLDPRHPAAVGLAAPRWVPNTAIVVAVKPPMGWPMPEGPMELPLQSGYAAPLHCANQYGASVEAAASVNWRRVQAGSRPISRWYGVHEPTVRSRDAGRGPTAGVRPANRLPTPWVAMSSSASIVGDVSNDHAEGVLLNSQTRGTIFFGVFALLGLVVAVSNVHNGGRVLIGVAECALMVVFAVRTSNLRSSGIGKASSVGGPVEPVD